VSARISSGGGGRPHRGRPPRGDETGRHRGADPTQARLLAVRLLDRTQRLQSFVDALLHHSLACSSLLGSDRALVTEIVYGTLRWRGRLDYMLDQIVDRGLEDLEPLVATTLRVGAYQIVFCDRIPDSAAIDESVRCARALGFERATGLVNAVLRRLAREHATIDFPSREKDPLAHLVHALSLPTWIAQRWLDIYGPEAAAALAFVSNQPPPFTVRANRKRISPEALLEELRPRFPEARRCRWAADGITLGRRGDPRREPAFLEGRFTVQDEAAQLVVAMLDPKPGDQVLDACAAPGTKTTAIAERLDDQGSVLATDRHARRLAMVARSARRLGLSGIRTLKRDVSKDLDDLPGLSALPDPGTPSLEGSGAEAAGPALFDRALADVPCSGLGTLRRNPDARWRARPEAILELAYLQLAILEHVARVLKPRGTLVYSTCTLVPEENEEVVAAFLNRNRDYDLVPRSALPAELADVVSEEGFLRCLPHLHDTDGFFAARFERSR